MRFSRRLLTSKIWFAMALLLAGCGRALGPEKMVTTTLVGRLYVGKRPVGKGWLQIIPTAGTVGRMRSARLAADGSFRVDQVPVGKVAIGFAGPTPEPIGDRYVDNFFRAQNSFPIRRTIAASPPVLDIDLADESVRFAQAQNSAP